MLWSMKLSVLSKTLSYFLILTFCLLSWLPLNTEQRSSLSCQVFSLSCYSSFLLFCPCDQWGFSWYCHLVWSMPKSGCLIIPQNSATPWLRTYCCNCSIPASQSFFLSTLVTVPETKCSNAVLDLKGTLSPVPFFKHHILLWAGYCPTALRTHWDYGQSYPYSCKLKVIVPPWQILAKFPAVTKRCCY